MTGQFFGGKMERKWSEWMEKRKSRKEEDLKKSKRLMAENCQKLKKWEDEQEGAERFSGVKCKRK